jgi:hypothetical protein
LPSVMRAADAHRLEAAVGYAAVASLAVAVGFAAFQVTGRITHFPPIIAAAGAALAASPAAFLLLRLLEGGPNPFPQPVFETVEIEPLAQPTPAELLLTDADRLEPADDDALELQDVLAEITPDSRVVQLFDPAAMPHAGRDHARDDRRLVGGAPYSATPDASEALFAALADLRRSLR